MDIALADDRDTAEAQNVDGWRFYRAFGPILMTEASQSAVAQCYIWSGLLLNYALVF